MVDPGHQAGRKIRGSPIVVRLDGQGDVVRFGLVAHLLQVLDEKGHDGLRCMTFGHTAAVYAEEGDVELGRKFQVASRLVELPLSLGKVHHGVASRDE